MNITVHTEPVDGGPFACHPARSWSVPEHRVLANDVVFPWEYDDRGVRAWVLWDQEGSLGLVWAPGSEEAFDLARDSGLFSADDVEEAQARSLRELATCDARSAYMASVGAPRACLDHWRERRAGALKALPAMTYRIGTYGSTVLRYCAGSCRLFLGQDPGFAFFARVPSQELSGHRLRARGYEWLVVPGEQLVIRTPGDDTGVALSRVSEVHPLLAGNLLCVRLDPEDIAVAAQAHAVSHRAAADLESVHMAPAHLDPARDYQLLCRFAECRGARRLTLGI